MAEQINFSSLLSEADVSALNPKWNPAMVSDYANISRTINQILNIVAMKGMVFTFTGAGAAAPTLGTEYNVKNLTRVSSGLYRAVYSSQVVNGANIDTDSVFSTGHTFGNTSAHEIEINQTVAGSFDINVWQINSGVKTAYDLIAGDEVSVSLYLNRQLMEAP